VKKVCCCRRKRNCFFFFFSEWWLRNILKLFIVWIIFIILKSFLSWRSLIILWYFYNFIHNWLCINCQLLGWIIFIWEVTHFFQKHKIPNKRNIKYEISKYWKFLLIMYILLMFNKIDRCYTLYLFWIFRSQKKKTVYYYFVDFLKENGKIFFLSCFSLCNWWTFISKSQVQKIVGQKLQPLHLVQQFAFLLLPFF